MYSLCILPEISLPVIIWRNKNSQGGIAALYLCYFISTNPTLWYTFETILWEYL